MGDRRSQAYDLLYDMSAIADHASLQLTLCLANMVRTAQRTDLLRIGNEARLLGYSVWTDWVHTLLAKRARELGDLEQERWFLDGLTTPSFKRIIDDQR